MVVSSSPFSYISIFVFSESSSDATFAAGSTFGRLHAFPPPPWALPCGGPKDKSCPAHHAHPYPTPCRAVGTTGRGRGVEGVSEIHKNALKPIPRTCRHSNSTKNELWEALYMEKLPINRPSGRYVTPCCWRVGGLPPRSRVPSHSAPDSR